MPTTLPPPVEGFLDGKRYAVAGVSRDARQPANHIFRRLADSGFEVFAVNPAAEEVEGVPAYADVREVPGPLDGVVVATHPDRSEDVVRACAEAGVPWVWLHRSFGDGSVSEDAVQACESLGLKAVVGGCPLMFCEPVDLGHRCMRWWLQRRGRVPT